MCWACTLGTLDRQVSVHCNADMHATAAHVDQQTMPVAICCSRPAVYGLSCLLPASAVYMSGLVLAARPYQGCGHTPAADINLCALSGSDCSGIITELGLDAAACSGVAVGQRVWGIAHGSLGTAVASPAATLVAMPPAGDPTAFSALPTAFATAQQALLSVAGVGPGDTVLVHAAAGAVGSAALQASCRSCRCLQGHLPEECCAGAVGRSEEQAPGQAMVNA